MILYRTPGRSFTRPPRTSTIECSCRLCPTPGMYAVTSIPLVSRTRATFRSAEFGFFGVVVYTRVHTPRRCGLPLSAGVLVLLVFAWRPLRTNCWMVGIRAFVSLRPPAVTAPSLDTASDPGPRGRACRPVPEAWPHSRLAGSILFPAAPRSAHARRARARPGTRGKSTHPALTGQNGVPGTGSIRTGRSRGTPRGGTGGGGGGGRYGYPAGGAGRGNGYPGAACGGGPDGGG